MSNSDTNLFQPRLLVNQLDDGVILNIFRTLNIDLNLSSPDVIKITPAKEFSIEDARLVIKKASLSPLFASHKVILIENFTNASIEAQNSLLKILEEPPASTLIIIRSETKNNILPTILSRVITVTRSPAKSAVADQAQIQQASTLISQLVSPKLDLGQKLNLITPYKEAELRFLLKFMLLALNRTDLTKNEIFLAKSLLDINNLTKINIRLRLALDNLIIALDQQIHP